MDKERITISIKKDILDLIDHNIDGINIRNRSHAIESFVSQGLGNNQSKNAVILLGGDNAIKQIPEVVTIIKKLCGYKFNKVYLAVGYLAPKIKDKLSSAHLPAIEIEYITKGEGTAGAILPLKKYFQDSFLVVNSPNKSDLDWDALNGFHKKHRMMATIATDNIDQLNGFYILEPKVFEYIPKGFSMLETDVFPRLLKENALTIYPLI